MEKDLGPSQWIRAFQDKDVALLPPILFLTISEHIISQQNYSGQSASLTCILVPLKSDGSHLFSQIVTTFGGLVKLHFWWWKHCKRDQDPLSFVSVDCLLQCSISYSKTHRKLRIQLLPQKSSGIKNPQISSLFQAVLSSQCAHRERICPGQKKKKKQVTKLQKINWEKPIDNYIFSFCHMGPVLTMSLKAMISALFCSNSSLHFSNKFSSLFKWHTYNCRLKLHHSLYVQS